MSDERSRVLVVEDEPGAAQLQRRWLERAGFRVVQAATLEEAVARMLEYDDIALVVLDYRLPGGQTGLDFQRQLRARGHTIPVIMVSGSADQQSAIEALRLGIEDFVPKSLEYMETLPAAVRATLERAAPRSADRVQAPARILLVEDDAATARLERGVLERAGFAVVTAASVREGHDVVRQGEVALIVLDHRLPDGSGIELHEQLRDAGTEIPSIIVTAFSDEATVIRALRAGVRDFLPKTPGFLDDLPVRAARVLEQSRLEQALRRSEERYRRILATANEGIWLLDPEMRITFVNERMAGLLGYQPAEMRGRLPSEFAASEDRARLDALFEARRSGRSEPAELRFRHRGGADIWVILAGRSILDDRGRFQGTLDMFTDVTGRRRAEEEVRRLNRVLEQRLHELQGAHDRLQESDRRKDEFLAMLGHELRNPLAAISNAAQVLQLVGPVEPKLGWARDVIRRQTQTLARMVDDLLDISRIERGTVTLQKEPVELAVVVAQAVETMRAPIEAKRLQLHVTLLPEPVLLDADRTRLVQAVANLLNNATKFTDENGEIRLEAERQGGEVILRVRDTGIGIEPRMLPRIFDLFAQADQSHARTYGGLGIGLTLVQRIVALHGGTVSAHSAGLGQGSEFVLRLPLAPRPAATAAATDPARVTADPSAPPLRVLVVDDDDDVGDGTALLIELLGNRARVVHSGSDALDSIRAERPQVVFIDIGMSGMDGFELARRLRDEPGLCDAVLVALTGYGQQDDRRRTREAGFDAHLVKPVTASTLEGLLEGIRTRRPVAAKP